MRIISGKFKGRRIIPPNNLPVRPTTDQAKEALFNILSNSFDFENGKVLDLFAGTGGISLEFASRGCPDVTSVELHFKCSQFIKTMSSALDIRSIRVIRTDVFRYIKSSKGKFDLIFADPPYDLAGLETIPEKVFKAAILNEGGILILEHPKGFDFTGHPCFTDMRRYGHVNFSFFMKSSTTNTDH
ncbi:MAG: RsmD family RNA methyltransferase [Bacteroidetes bacterium]|nr:RsmD family RNA methyltransferase [Bacteroidota bacterium]